MSPRRIRSARWRLRSSAPSVTNLWLRSPNHDLGYDTQSVSGSCVVGFSGVQPVTTIAAPATIMSAPATW